MANLRAALKQAKPFNSVYQEAFLNLARTHTVLSDGLDRVLGPRGLSITQYNVLRMLRGAGREGLCRNEIGRRLITRMPDVTRLIDRMERDGLVSRVRSMEDRRLVNTILTTKGGQVVDKLDREVAKEHERTLAHMTKAQLTTLVELLGLVQDGAR
jgi:DNA-binding MarR family transcriptional regulator